MKTKFTLTVIVLTTALIATTSVIQAASPAAPTAQVTPTAPEPSPAPAVNLASAPNQIIYLTQLPSAGTLVNIAAAQGLAIEQISQTATQILVVYKYANGQTNTVSYQLLPSATPTPAVAGVPAPAGSVTVAVPAQTTVVYQGPTPAYYYDPFYYPWPYFGPVALSLGFGFHDGWYHGGWNHGGWNHGGGHGWHR